MRSDSPPGNTMPEGRRLDPELVERVRRAYEHKLEAFQTWGLTAGLSPDQDIAADPLATIRKKLER